MPIFEYKCADCGEDFEKLIFGKEAIRCPKCNSESVKKKFSTFGMSGVENPGTGGGSSACGSCSGKSCSTC